MPAKTRNLVGRIGVVALLGALTAGIQAVGNTQQSAPAQPASRLLSLSVLKIKPDMLTRWMDFQKTETIPMLQKAGIKSRDAWATAIFGEGFEYIFVTPVETMAQYDQPAPAIRVLGEGGARAYNEKNRGFIASTHTYLIRTRPDLGFPPAPTMTPKFAMVANLSIVPGRGAEFEALIKSDVTPALKQAGVVAYGVAQTMLGGDVNAFSTVTYFDTYSQMDQPFGLEKALGAAGMVKLSQKFAGIIARHERRIIRYVSELSFKASGS